MIHPFDRVGSAPSHRDLVLAWCVQAPRTARLENDMEDQYQDDSGNVMVDLVDENGVTTPRLVAELVLESFRGPRPSLNAIPWHLNGDKADNDLTNLIWRET
jgi:hypothetical protein